MRVLSIVGNRPQFIKSGPVSLALREEGVEEVVLHTGQHYDRELSEVFFDELGLAAADLPPRGGLRDPRRADRAHAPGDRAGGARGASPTGCSSTGTRTRRSPGRSRRPSSAAPVAHVEAGLRSFDRTMPEELNRIVVDRLSTLLFCPTRDSPPGTSRPRRSPRACYVVGDVMLDANLELAPLARERSHALAEAGVEPGRYLLLTLHREANVRRESLARIAARSTRSTSRSSSRPTPAHAVRSQRSGSSSAPTSACSSRPATSTSPRSPRRRASC